MCAGGSAQHRTYQLRPEFGQKAHGAQSGFPQVAKMLGLMVGLEQPLIVEQSLLDFSIFGQNGFVGDRQSQRGLAFGGSKILDAFLGHDPGALLS